MIEVVIITVLEIAFVSLVIYGLTFLVIPKRKWGENYA